MLRCGHEETLLTMGRRVHVCGTPKAIALDSERDENRSKYGCLLQKTENNLVLRSGENLLRVVDAQRFCVGSMDVRHVVELPSNVTFSKRNSSGEYGVAWECTQQDDGKWQSIVYIVDFQTGEVTARQLPSLNEQIADVSVDANGEKIAVVGATSGKLHGWSRSDWDDGGSFETRSQAPWRLVEGNAIDTSLSGACSCGQFVCSAVMGNCFVYLRAGRDTSASIVVEKWIFDVDACWAQVSYSSRTMGTTSPSDTGSTEGLVLFMTEQWKFAVLTVGNMLYHFQVDQDLGNSLVKCLVLDQRILSGTWIEQDVAFAMLLVNGQISIASINHAGRFELVAITTSVTMSKRLSLSALLGKAIPAALQLAWVGQDDKVVVDFGTSCAAFKLDIVDEEFSSGVDDSNESIELFTIGAFAQRNRRVIARLDKEFSDFGDWVRELLERKSSPSPNDLLHIARIALSRSQNIFEDLYFMLLYIIYQQLTSDSISNSNSCDPIDCIGKSLKVMEMLVSFTISMEAPILRQTSSRILSALPAGATKSDRKFYYRKEIAAISLVQKMRKGTSESEDWWVNSSEATAFLAVYFTTTRALLHTICSSENLKPGEASQVMSLCERIVEHEDGLFAVDSIVQTERAENPAIERLKELAASYTVICWCLHVDGVMIDVEHISSLVPSSVLRRKEMLCCFLRPWLRPVDDPQPILGETDAAVNQAVRFAVNFNTIQLLVNFCMASRSFIANLCVQGLCKATAKTIEQKQLETASEDIVHVNDLHWQACETYIGEAMAILQRIGARRQFKRSNREAECSVGRMVVCIGAEFDSYYRSLTAELAKSTAQSRGTPSKSSLWEFSHLDKWLRARVICLISRIVWHLEAASKDIGSLFHRAFVTDFFEAQVESFSEENKKLHACISKVRALNNPMENELRFPRFRQPTDVYPKSSLRSLKISRSLVLVAWALWLREKAAYCSQGAHIGRVNGEFNEKEALGALAATCALHLNSQGTIYGNSEELLIIQLSLLEDVAIINPSKAAAVMAWGFPVQKILTRHLQRYKRLRQEVQHSVMSVSLEESELQCQQIQMHIRRAFHSVENNRIEQLTRDDEIDVLVGCCCAPEVLQLMSVLTKCPYDVIAPSDSVSTNSRHKTSTPHLETPEDVDIILPASTDTEQSLTSTIDQDIVKPHISESVISRDEVIALLQTQTRHLEEKIHAVKAAEQSRLSIAHEDGHEIPTEGTTLFSDRKRKITTSKSPEKHVAAREAAVHLADAQRMARISFQVRDLGRHRYSSATLGTDKQVNLIPKPAQRHDSVRNALKLFRLRQENCGHAICESINSSTTNENGTSIIENSVNCSLDSTTSCETRSPAAVSSKRDKLKRAGVQRRFSRNQRGSGSRNFPDKGPIYPLRLEYGINNASLKLLGRNSAQRNPSLKKRQFVHQQRELPSRLNVPILAATNTSRGSTDVTLLKTTSVQTNDSIEAAKPQPSAARETKELMNTVQNDIGPEKESPVAQQCEVNTKISRKGVGIQCRVTESGLTNGRRKRGPPPLNIADKYPIWLDLDGAGNVGARSHFKERKKFLQVVRFGGPARDDPALSTLTSSVSTVLVSRRVNSEDGSDENQSDGQHSPSFSNISAQEGETTKQIGNALTKKYRARYREHFPVHERLRKSDDKEVANGINSLIDLRDNMQRMTQRLRVLETCANSIDEEFKVSQKRLSRIGDMRPGGASSQSRVLQNIDEILERTEEISSRHEGSKVKGGLLSKKASSDLNTAKKLLETIEQLTIGTDDH